MYVKVVDVPITNVIKSLIRNARIVKYLSKTTIVKIFTIQVFVKAYLNAPIVGFQNQGEVVTFVKRIKNGALIVILQLIIIISVLLKKKLLKSKKKLMAKSFLILNHLRMS